MPSQESLPFTVEQLSPDLSFGKVVTGLERAHLQDPTVQDALRHCWVKDGLVLFRVEDLDEEFLLELSRIFGPLEPHPVPIARDKKYPELITITSSKTIMSVDGVVGAGHLGWHSDLAYVERINHGGILRAMQPSTTGGVTGFLDQIAAYDSLPQAMKDRIEDLYVLYQVTPYDKLRYGTRGKLKLVDIEEAILKVWERADLDYPPVAHPMVFVQPETGRKILNISPFFAVGIEGMEEAEAHALLEDLSEHICSSPAYHHTWSTNELILWDNWRMLHSVTQVPVDQVRIMQRTTIKGDYGVGRKAVLREHALH